MKKYHINEVFLSFQGEGARSGSLNVFVRFAHCNLKCNLKEHGFECDTDYSGSMEMSQDDLVEKISEVGQKCKNIIFTGGEPALQIDFELTKTLRDLRYYVAIETNGTIDISKLTLDWISCSPKTAEHTIKIEKCNELRYVLGKDRALPKPHAKADNYFLSPVFNPDWSIDYESLIWIMKLIKENPTWKMSVQTQKLLNLR